MNNNDSNANKHRNKQLQEVMLALPLHCRKAGKSLLHEFRLKGIPKPTDQLMPDICPPLQDQNKTYTNKLVIAKLWSLLILCLMREMRLEGP